MRSKLLIKIAQKLFEEFEFLPRFFQTAGRRGMPRMSGMEAFQTRGVDPELLRQEWPSFFSKVQELASRMSGGGLFQMDPRAAWETAQTRGKIIDTTIQALKEGKIGIAGAGNVLNTLGVNIFELSPEDVRYLKANHPRLLRIIGKARSVPTEGLVHSGWADVFLRRGGKPRTAPRPVAPAQESMLRRMSENATLLGATLLLIASPFLLRKAERTVRKWLDPDLYTRQKFMGLPRPVVYGGLGLAGAGALGALLYEIARRRRKKKEKEKE